MLPVKDVKYDVAWLSASACEIVDVVNPEGKV